MTYVNAIENSVRMAYHICHSESTFFQRNTNDQVMYVARHLQYLILTLNIWAVVSTTYSGV